MKRLYGVTKERNFKLEYYIVDDGKAYGIEIVKKYIEDGIEYSEKGVCTAIDPSCNAVQGIVEKLLRNTVTPMGLAYVMEDMAAR